MIIIIGIALTTIGSILLVLFIKQIKKEGKFNLMAGDLRGLIGIIGLIAIGIKLIYDYFYK